MVLKRSEKAGVFLTSYGPSSFTVSPNALPIFGAVVRHPMFSGVAVLHGEKKYTNEGFHE